MRFVYPIVLGAALVLVVGVAQAQEQLHYTRESVLRPALEEDRVVVDRVRADLAKVRAAEETFHAANGTYAAELTDLQGLQLSSGTSVVILTSGPKGWQAEATHPSLPEAEVVHVMRLAPGETCPMDHGGGMASRQAPSAQDQY